MDRRRHVSGIEPWDHRDRLVRAAELRRALRPGSLFVAAVFFGTGLLFATRFPANATLLFSVWTLGAAANLALWFVADRVPPSFVVPLTLVFASIPATALLVSAFVPSTLQTMISGFTMLPVAVPLFLAWSRVVRTGWVVSYSIVFVGVIVVTGFGHLDTIQRIDVGTGVLIGALIGWLGGEMLERLRERTLDQATELHRLNDELQVRATTDALTGLANRRQLDTDLQALSMVPDGEGGSCAFVMLDLDRFKRLNDELGHAAGDEALRSVSAELQRVVRRRDTIYRYGGEEFLVIMREASLEAGAATGERIREAVGDLQIQAAARPASPTLTISCGVAYSPVARAHWDSVLAAADSALYEAKATGRNRVCVATAFAGQDPPLLPRDRRRPPLRKSTPAAREHVPVSGAG